MICSKVSSAPAIPTKLQSFVLSFGSRIHQWWVALDLLLSAHSSTQTHGAPHPHPILHIKVGRTWAMTSRGERVTIIRNDGF